MQNNFKLLTVVVAVLLLAIVVTGCGAKKDCPEDIKLSGKKMEADNYNHPMVTGKLKNITEERVYKVAVKAVFSDEEGKMIDETYAYFGPIGPGKEIPFTLKGSCDYYSVKNYDVWVEAAE